MFLVHLLQYRAEKKFGTWLREISSCSCLTFLPDPAWVQLSKICKDFFSALYMYFDLIVLFQLLEVSAKMKSAGIKVTNVGTGSTPCCSHSAAAAMRQLTEIHPGNYVFYDTQQMAVVFKS